MYRNKEPKVFDSADDLINEYHSLYGDNFKIDYQFFLKQLYAKNELMTNHQVDRFIKKMIKGKSRSLLTYGYYNNIDVLNVLTERHLLTEKQVTSIITCMIGFPPSFKWVDNLTLLGYKLLNKQRDKLIALGYKIGVDLILNKETSNIDELNSICSSKDFDLGKMETFLKKFKIVPQLSTIEILVNKINSNNNKDTDFHLAIEKMIEYGFPLSFAFVEKIFRKINLKLFANYIDKLFTEGHIKLLSDIDFMFKAYEVTNNFSPTVVILTNIDYMISLFLNKNIPLNGGDQYLKLLMTRIDKHEKDKKFDLKLMKKENELDYDNKMEEYKKNIDQYYYRIYTYDAKLVLNKYFDVAIKLIQASSNPLELLEHACLVSDRLIFDILIDKLNKFTEKCVSNVCSSGSSFMLQILLNMKALPTLECLKSIHCDNNIMFDLLLKNGLPINRDTIEISLTKGLYISNLQDYGYQPASELYEICYKHDRFPYQYISQLKTNSSLNMDIRLAIKENPLKETNTKGNKTSKEANLKITDDEIIQKIKDNNIIPDYMMYGHAVSSGKTKLVEYFEKEYGMKPNLDALILIENVTSRRNYLERIISCHNISQDIITTTAKIKSLDIANVKKENDANVKEEDAVNVNENAKKASGKKTKLLIKGKTKPKPKTKELVANN